jgi:hypothetical protein
MLRPLLIGGFQAGGATGRVAKAAYQESILECLVKEFGYHQIVIIFLSQIPRY